ncbi:hypothetical protein, partial [[Eubacterium] cellulosolvens]
KAKGYYNKGKSWVKGMYDKGKEWSNGLYGKAKGYINKGKSWARGIYDKGKEWSNSYYGRAKGYINKGKNWARSMYDKGKDWENGYYGKAQGWINKSKSWVKNKMEYGKSLVINNSNNSDDSDDANTRPSDVNNNTNKEVTRVSINDTTWTDGLNYGFISSFNSLTKLATGPQIFIARAYHRDGYDQERYITADLGNNETEKTRSITHLQTYNSLGQIETETIFNHETEDDSYGWWGLCNGWVNSSVMENEPDPKGKMISAELSSALLLRMNPSAHVSFSRPGDQIELDVGINRELDYEQTTKSITRPVPSKLNDNGTTDGYVKLTRETTALYEGMFVQPGFYIPDLQVSSKNIDDPEPRDKIVDNESAPEKNSDRFFSVAMENKLLGYNLPGTVNQAGLQSNMLSWINTPDDDVKYVYILQSIYAPDDPLYDPLSVSPENWYNFRINQSVFELPGSSQSSVPANDNAPLILDGGLSGRVHENYSVDFHGRIDIRPDFTKQFGESVNTTLKAGGFLTAKVERSTFESAELKGLFANTKMGIGGGVSKLDGTVEGNIESVYEVDFNGKIKVQADFEYAPSNKSKANIGGEGFLEACVKRNKFKGADLGGLRVTTDINIGGGTLRLEGAIRGKIDEGYKVDFTGELTVEEDFVYQAGDSVKTTLFKGGKATATVEQSKFKEATLNLTILADIEIKGQHLKLKGSIGGKIESGYTVDVEGTITVKEDFEYEKDKVKATLVKGGKLTVKVESNEFKWANVSGLRVQAKINISDKELVLQGSINKGKYEGNSPIELTGSLTIRKEHRYKKGNITATLYRGGSVDVEVKASKLVKVGLSVNFVVETDIESEETSDLQLNGTIEGAYDSGGSTSSIFNTILSWHVERFDFPTFDSKNDSQLIQSAMSIQTDHIISVMNNTPGYYDPNETLFLRMTKADLIEAVYKSKGSPNVTKKPEVPVNDSNEEDMTKLDLVNRFNVSWNTRRFPRGPRGELMGRGGRILSRDNRSSYYSVDSFFDVFIDIDTTDANEASSISWQTASHYVVSQMINRTDTPGYYDPGNNSNLTPRMTKGDLINYVLKSKGKVSFTKKPAVPDNDSDDSDMTKEDLINEINVSLKTGFWTGGRTVGSGTVVDIMDTRQSNESAGGSTFSTVNHYGINQEQIKIAYTGGAGGGNFSTDSFFDIFYEISNQESDTNLSFMTVSATTEAGISAGAADVSDLFHADENDSAVFKGEIVSVTNVRLGQSGNGSDKIIINSYNKMHVLTRGRQTRTWTNSSGEVMGVEPSPFHIESFFDVSLELEGSVEGTNDENYEVSFDGSIELKNNVEKQFGESVKVGISSGARLQVNVGKNSFKGAELTGIVISATVNVSDIEIELEGNINGSINENYKVEVNVSMIGEMATNVAKNTSDVDDSGKLNLSGINKTFRFKTKSSIKYTILSNNTDNNSSSQSSAGSGYVLMTNFF